MRVSAVFFLAVALPATTVRAVGEVRATPADPDHERNNDMATIGQSPQMRHPICVKCGNMTDIKWNDAYTFTFGMPGLYAICQNCEYTQQIKALDES